MNDLKIVKGNTFETVIEVRAYTYKGEEIVDFDLRKCAITMVAVHVNGDTQSVDKNDYDVMSSKKLVVRWRDKNMRPGSYALEVKGTLDGIDWRFYDKSPIFYIVNTNNEANIPSLCIKRDCCYKVKTLQVYLYNATTMNKIDYVGSDNYVYKWDAEKQNYIKSNVYVKGEKGLKGDRGIPGPKGDPGPQGPRGEKGTTDYNELTNKPVLATVAISGSYIDLNDKPTDSLISEDDIDDLCRI